MNVDYKDYEGALKKFIDRWGIVSAETNYTKSGLYSELWARYVSEQALRMLNPNLDIVQHTLTDVFDLEFVSGGTKINLETKCRNKYVNEYPTTDISFKKGDALSNNKGWLLIFFNKGCDFLIFDLARSHPKISEWTHSKTTEISGDKTKITEGRMCFNPKEAIYRGNLMTKEIY